MSEQTRKELNVALANGLVMKARQIARRLDAEERAEGEEYRMSDSTTLGDLAPGAALASALMAANYPGDSGEDVDRLIAELAKRGYALRAAAPAPPEPDLDVEPEHRIERRWRAVANRVLDRPSADPDDDAGQLARAVLWLIAAARVEDPRPNDDASLALALRDWMATTPGDRQPEDDLRDAAETWLAFRDEHGLRP